MLIIGMTGPIGHGKSTFAKALERLVPETVHLETSMIIAEVANALHASTNKIPDRDHLESINDWLKPLASILLETAHVHSSFSQLQIESYEVERHPIEYGKLFLHIENLTRNKALLRQQITRENKEAYRPILQWLGGYLVKKVDAGIWCKEILRRAHDAGLSGCKICVIGGLRFPSDATLVRQAGGVVVKVYRPGHLQYDMLDPTERERDNIDADCTIVSNGTVDDMNRCALRVLNDLQTHKLEKSYQTKGS